MHFKHSGGIFGFLLEVPASKASTTEGITASTSISLNMVSCPLICEALRQAKARATIVLVIALAIFLILELSAQDALIIFQQ
jgi:hypothetical protein